MGSWCNGQLVVWAFIVILLFSSLWFIWNNSFCQIPARYTSTASNIWNLPITPGFYTFQYYPGSERSGEDGVQGGELELHGDGLREARHQGLHLDAAQGAGGVGRQLQVDSPLPVVTVLLWTIASLLLNPHRIGSTQIVLMLDALSWPMWLTTEQSAINISRKSLVWIYFLVWSGVDKTTFFWKCTTF